MYPDGSLLAYAGGTSTDAKIVAALVSNIWFSYDKTGKNVFGEQLKSFIIDSEV